MTGSGCIFVLLEFFVVRLENYLKYGIIVEIGNLYLKIKFIP